MWFFVTIKLYHMEGILLFFSISRGYLELFLVGKVRCFNNTKTQILVDLFLWKHLLAYYQFELASLC